MGEIGNMTLLTRGRAKIILTEPRIDCPYCGRVLNIIQTSDNMETYELICDACNNEFDWETNKPYQLKDMTGNKTIYINLEV